MNIRDLKYLITVANLRHFGKAAEACFVSQPTLSTQLKKLEDELNIQIFERRNKKIFPTSIGKAIIAQAKIVLREVESLQNIAKLSRDPLSGPLRLGLIPTLGPYLLPHVIPTLKEKYDKCEFFLLEEKTQQLIKKLKEGELDAAILALPIPTTDLIIHKLFAENFHIALPKNNKLSTYKHLNVNQLNDETLLLLEEGHCLRDQALEVCENANINEKHCFSTTSLETLRNMVAAGTGITLLPSLAIKTKGIDDDSITIVDFNEPVPTRTIAMIWPKHCAKQICCEKIAEEISTIAKDILSINES